MVASPKQHLTNKTIGRSKEITKEILISPTTTLTYQDLEKPLNKQKEIGRAHV